MNGKNFSKTLTLAVSVVLAAMLAGSGAFAARPPGVGGGGGGGGGGGPPTSEAAQNLSVPAILVGSLGTLVCGESDLAPSALVPPTGTPLTGYDAAVGYYWVQKVHTWKAQCFKATEASVFGAWGDNLAGDAKLKVGSPIRVEIVLTNMTNFTAADGGLGTIPSGTLQGYNVIKLQNTLDRLSAYGHQAGGDEISGWTNIPQDVGQASWVVHDAGMQISVENTDTGQFVVPLQQITPEINATGKVVYGYNLRVSAAGNYQIRFKTSDAVTFTDTDVPNENNDANNAYLDIVVIPGGGQGGGNPGGGGKPTR